MQKKTILIMWTSAFLFISSSILAHQPVIVKNNSSKDKPVPVKKPEISFAFYGELAGKPHYYKIDAKKPFYLYVNILVPDYFPKATAISKHDISFEILKGDTSIIVVDGNSFEWKRFYEPYGKDHYYMGPEFARSVDSGIYYIKIFNKDNVGKYSLAIGKKESFTPWGLVVAFIRARSLDKWFFKP